METIGSSKCNECGGVKVLEIRNKVIYSKCLNCGFTEWEWSTGDSLGYLRYLSKLYKVDYEDLVKKVEES
jgi:hypothetical protein